MPTWLAIVCLSAAALAAIYLVLVILRPERF
ncbi:MAG: potassium-transporting ATPase subunit F [Proteobacteria bacterium]|nr:potassium-transporting ATPase subunit F [Pseudomonadota bacterium]